MLLALGPDTQSSKTLYQVRIIYLYSSYGQFVLFIAYLLQQNILSLLLTLMAQHNVNVIHFYMITLLSDMSYWKTTSPILAAYSRGAGAGQIFARPIKEF